MKQWSCPIDAEELDKQRYYQGRNRQARVSHTETRHGLLTALGVDVDKIKKS